MRFRVVTSNCSGPMVYWVNDGDGYYVDGYLDPILAVETIEAGGWVWILREGLICAVPAAEILYGYVEHYPHPLPDMQGERMDSRPGEAAPMPLSGVPREADRAKGPYPPAA